MRRREFIALCGSMALVPRVLAQSARVYRVGLLSPGVPITESNPQSAPFLKGMAEHGYSAGHNLVIERRGAMGRTADLPRLAEELVAASKHLLRSAIHLPLPRKPRVSRPSLHRVLAIRLRLVWSRALRVLAAQ